MGLLVIDVHLNQTVFGMATIVSAFKAMLTSQAFVHSLVITQTLAIKQLVVQLEHSLRKTCRDVFCVRMDV